MSEQSTQTDQTGWSRQVLDAAVNELMQRGVITAELVEARPVWSLNDMVMIGQIRESAAVAPFKWVISGEVPLDHADATAATTARDAARYFALKWQLDATRYRDPLVQQELGSEHRQSWDELGKTLIDIAEALMKWADDDRLWQ